MFGNNIRIAIIIAIIIVRNLKFEKWIKYTKIID